MPNIKFYLEDDKENHYLVKESGHGHGPWFEGSKFRASHKPPIDKHFFVVREHTSGNGVYSEGIIGVAHNKLELEKRIYKCAMNYCKNLAKLTCGEFINNTKRAKQ